MLNYKKMGAKSLSNFQFHFQAKWRLQIASVYRWASTLLWRSAAMAMYNKPTDLHQKSRLSETIIAPITLLLFDNNYLLLIIIIIILLLSLFSVNGSHQSMLSFTHTCACSSSPMLVPFYLHLLLTQIYLPIYAPFKYRFFFLLGREQSSQNFGIGFVFEYIYEICYIFYKCWERVERKNMIQNCSIQLLFLFAEDNYYIFTNYKKKFYRAIRCKWCPFIQQFSTKTV